MTNICILKLGACALLLVLASCAASGPVRPQGPAPISGPERLYLRAPAPQVAPLHQPLLRPLKKPKEEPL